MTTSRTQQAKAAFRAVSDLLSHDDLLTPAIRASLRELREQLSEILCPYPAAELDAHKRKLDEQFPGYEHWYIRCGETVTWCDRPKPAPDPGTRTAPQGPGPAARTGTRP